MACLKRVFCCIFALFLCLLCGVMPAHAAGSYGVTAVFHVDQVPVTGVSFQIYRVAGPDYVMLDEFADYRVAVDWYDEASVSSAAGLLAEYVQRDQVAADAVSVTDADGRAAFVGLPEGIYLLTGDLCVTGSITRTPVPVLFSLPLDGEEIQVKYESQEPVVPPEDDPPEEDTVRIKVLKVWDDDRSEDRPRSVSVQLLRNGRVYDTQRLYAGNNWRYTWDDLSDQYRWTVVEASVPEGYAVSSERTGSVTVITNHLEQPVVPPGEPEDPIPPEEPVPPEEIPGEDPPGSEEPVPPGDPVPPEDGSKLPQTGLLWWPVAAMSGSGVVLLTGGLAVGRRRKISRSILVLGGAVFVLLAAVQLGANLREEQLAGEASQLTLVQIEPAVEAASELQEPVPDYELAPEMEMPAVSVDGRRYVGALQIPALGLELPVLEEWSYSGLKSSPAIYTGSIYADDAIIAGHNYRTHFGSLRNLSEGDSVSFTDVDGNVFSYQVSYLETLDGTDVDGIQEGEWDLTLFTCTLDSAHRVVVRCTRI